MNNPHEIHTGPWDTPSPAPGEMLISVGAAGICAGDMYIYQGKNPYVIYPSVAGHEVAGTVAAVGEGVTNVSEGTRVVIEPFIGCGKCYPCRQGKTNCCANLRIIGVHMPGGYADFVKAPATHVHPIPETLSLFEATFTEPVAIGVQACRRAEVGAEYVLVLGCGPIGLALIEVARARGAHVVATDIIESRMEIARQLGAETLLADDDLLETIMQQTHGEGAPVVIEATGNTKAIESTVDMVAAGGRICIVGLVKRGTMISLPGLDFTRKEMTIVGSRASVNCFPESLELLASGKIQYPKVATRFNMWDAPDVFQHLSKYPDAVQKGVLMHDPV
ncbi:MAG: alcohol dehydrogenase catalytic domain-containing protein [Chloroflexota bacterium]|nr:alcohol dehydrogenase catalytic domain-containing protein [Chloroflexota bacterium]